MVPSSIPSNNKKLVNIVFMEIIQLFPCSPLLQVWNAVSEETTMYFVLSRESSMEPAAALISSIVRFLLWSKSSVQQNEAVAVVSTHIKFVSGGLGEFSKESHPLPGSKLTVTSTAVDHTCSADGEVTLVTSDVLDLSAVAHSQHSSTSLVSAYVRRDNGFFRWHHSDFMITTGHNIHTNVQGITYTTGSRTHTKLQSIDSAHFRGKVWPAKLTEEMTTFYIGAVYRPCEMFVGNDSPSAHSREFTVAPREYILSDVAVFKVGRLGFRGSLRPLKHIHEPDCNKHGERLLYAVPQPSQFLGLVHYQSMSGSGTLNVVGIGHRCMLSNNVRFYQIFYIAISADDNNPCTLAAGDSGAPVTRPDGTLHSFVVGDLPMILDSGGLPVKAYMLTPAHLALAQAQRILGVDRDKVQFVGKRR